MLTFICLVISTVFPVLFAVDSGRCYCHPPANGDCSLCTRPNCPCYESTDIWNEKSSLSFARDKPQYVMYDDPVALNGENAEFVIKVTPSVMWAIAGMLCLLLLVNLFCLCRASLCCKPKPYATVSQVVSSDEEQAFKPYAI